MAEIEVVDVEIIDVDKYETVSNLPISISTIELLNVLSIKSSVPIDDILLLTSEGVLIDRSQPFPHQLGTSNKIFLFNKHVINLNYWIEEIKVPNFTQVFYDEKINFDKYEKINEPFDKIISIDEELFNNSKVAKEIYTTYMLQTQKFEKIKKLTNTRLDASEALLKQLNFYYKSIKLKWNQALDKARKLQQEVNQAQEIFRSNYENIRNKKFNGIIDTIIKQKNFKDYSDNIYIKVNNLFTKISKLKPKILDKVKKNLKDSQSSLEVVRNTSKNSIEKINEAVYSQNAKFKIGLEIIDFYNEFRRIFETAEDQSTSAEGVFYGSKMLSMGYEIPKYSNILEELKKILAGMNDNEHIIRTHLERVGKFYKIKAIKLCVTSTYELKFLLSDKISKLWSRYDQLNKKKSFLNVPLRLESACSAAEEEVQRSNRKMDQIREMYILLCQAIIQDYFQREEFLTLHGSILPKEIFPNLTKPGVNRSYLRQLVKFPAVQEDLPEETLKKFTKEELIKYYEGKLGLMERNYSQKIEESRLREKKLQEHLNYLQNYKEKISRENNNQQNLLKEYSIQLVQLRNKHGSEKFINLFQKEICNLKEKEQAFKAVHLSNLKQIIEENENLRNKINI